MKLIVCMLFLCSFSFAATNPAMPEVSLKDFLKTALKIHPISKEQELLPQIDDQLQKSGYGKYFPHLSAEAIDSSGFPGSNSALQINGIMGSAFRSGPAGGIVLDQLLYDFGRTSSILKKYKAQSELQEAQVSQEKLLLLSHLVNLYVSCSRMRYQLSEQKKLIEYATLIEKETSRMTATGQRSIVDRSLIRTDLAEQKLAEADFQMKQDSFLKQIAIYTEKKNFLCSELNTHLTPTNLKEFKVTPPSYLLAKARMHSSEAEKEFYHSNMLPSLNLVGSYGVMQSSRLVPEKNYNLGVGLSFPFFNGGEDWHKANAAEFSAQLSEQELNAATTDINAHIQDLDDRIHRLEVTLQALNEDEAQVEKTMKVAVKRYVNLQGGLIDVRESFKKLDAIYSEDVELTYELNIDRFIRGILDTTQVKYQ